MSRKSVFTFSLLSVLAAPAVAMDVAPYKVGQELTTEQAHELVKRFKDRKVQDWKPPASADAIKGHKDAELINYGIQVLDKTAATIGPLVKDESLRYSGNNLNCSSCHLKGDTGLPGTRYFGIPFTNIENDYPEFRSRDMKIGSAADRVNGCMTRSMGSGKPLPEDSREMQGIIAYFNWLAEGTEAGLAMEGTGLPQLEFPARAADPEKGKVVYNQSCASCHGPDAMGVRSPEYDNGAGHLFPPLAGNDSFNNGAGMSRLKTATRFIYANMPLGVTADKPTLSVEQAYDVAGFVESLPRPERAGRDKDFPNPAFRPADYPVPAYFNGDKAALEKARYGPYE